MKKVFCSRHLIGSVVQYNTNCPECDESNQLYDSKKLNFECSYCGLEYVGTLVRTEVIVNKVKRKPLSSYKKKKLKENQNNCCYYCSREFNTYVYDNDKRYRRLRRLTAKYDHKTPWAYSQNDSFENFVASCWYCNGIKTDHHFDDEQEIFDIVKYKWDKAIRNGRFQFE